MSDACLLLPGMWPVSCRCALSEYSVPNDFWHEQRWMVYLLSASSFRPPPPPPPLDPPPAPPLFPDLEESAAVAAAAAAAAVVVVEEVEDFREASLTSGDLSAFLEDVVVVQLLLVARDRSLSRRSPFPPLPVALALAPCWWWWCWWWWWCGCCCCWWWWWWWLGETAAAAAAAAAVTPRWERPLPWTIGGGRRSDFDGRMVDCSGMMLLGRRGDSSRKSPPNRFCRLWRLEMPLLRPPPPPPPPSFPRPSPPFLSLREAGGGSGSEMDLGRLDFRDRSRGCSSSASSVTTVEVSEAEARAWAAILS